MLWWNTTLARAVSVCEENVDIIRKILLFWTVFHTTLGLLCVIWKNLIDILPFFFLEMQKYPFDWSSSLGEGEMEL